MLQARRARPVMVVERSRAWMENGLYLVGCSQGCKEAFQLWLGMEFRPRESLQGSLFAQGAPMSRAKAAAAGTGCANTGCRSPHPSQPCRASAQSLVQAVAKQREAEGQWDNTGCEETGGDDGCCIGNALGESVPQICDCREFFSCRSTQKTGYPYWIVKVTSSCKRRYLSLQAMCRYFWHRG